MTREDLLDRAKQARKIHDELMRHYREHKPTRGIADSVRAALLLESTLNLAAENLDVEPTGYLDRVGMSQKDR